MSLFSKKPAQVVVAEEVFPGIYDDGHGSCYIVAKGEAYHSIADPPFSDDVSGDLMIKKRRWQERFPSKRLVAMAMVHEGEGLTVTKTFLIHYEMR